MRKEPFANEHYYHVYNRGVEKRTIFIDESDYYRFLGYLIVFNDTNKYHANPGRNLKALIAEAQNRKPLVDILAYCLMPNHFHLLLKQRVDNGIPIFLQRLGVGYTHYFNTKNKRSGVLFQGKTKNILIDDNSYLLQLSRYINLNPKKLPGIEGMENAKNYKWSSANYYCSETKNSNILAGTDVVFKQFSNHNEYEKFLLDYQEDKDLSQIQSYILE